MTERELKSGYFEWLCDLIQCDKIDKSWWLLCKDLYNRTFYPLVPHDENRASDGLELREEYLDYICCPSCYEIDGDCTVLEMLIGLARRMDFETSDPYDHNAPDKTTFWFWEMVDNLGLLAFDDESYVELGGMRYIDEVITRFIDRKYDPNGNGGLFPLSYSRDDQRDVEIWFQANAYLTEHAFV